MVIDAASTAYIYNTNNNEPRDKLMMETLLNSKIVANTTLVGGEN